MVLKETPSNIGTKIVVFLECDCISYNLMAYLVIKQGPNSCIVTTTGRTYSMHSPTVIASRMLCCFPPEVDDLFPYNNEFRFSVNIAWSSLLCGSRSFILHTQKQVPQASNRLLNPTRWMLFRVECSIYGCQSRFRFAHFCTSKQIFVN